MLTNIYIYIRPAFDSFPFPCRELGIGIVPYSPLGRGFFGGRAVVESLTAGNFLVYIVNLVSFPFA